MPVGFWVCVLALLVVVFAYHLSSLPAYADEGPQIRSSADIPPEHLIEPLPEEKDVGPQVSPPTVLITYPLEEFYAHWPTAEEWQRVLRVLFGLVVEEEAEEELVPAPPPAVEPKPAEVAPEEEPELPGEEIQPEAPAEKFTLAMTTEEAVSLALQVKSSGLSDDYARVVLAQGRVSGNTSSKEYDMVGQLDLYYEEISAQARKGHIDQNAEVVTLSDSVLLASPDYNLSCEDLTVSFKEKSFSARTFVRFKKGARGKEPTDTSTPKRERVINIFKNEPTEVYANILSYSWDTEQMTAAGEVKVVQEKVTATMDKLDYNPEAKTYRLTGNIFVTLLESEWIFEHELVEEKDIDLAEALTEKETTLEADSLETGEDNDLMTLRGKGETLARITQEDKELSAEEIVFDDRSKVMTATGKVTFYQQKGDWLRQGKLIEREPDEEGKRYLERELTSTSEYLTFDYDNRVLHQWGEVEIVSGDETIIGDDLLYEEKQKLLHLKGNVGYYRGRDEYLYADEVIVHTEENRFEFIGIIESYIFTSKEEREKAEAEAESGAEEGEEAAEGEGTPGAGLLTSPQ